MGRKGGRRNFIRTLTFSQASTRNPGVISVAPILEEESSCEIDVDMRASSGWLVCHLHLISSILDLSLPHPIKLHVAGRQAEQSVRNIVC